MPRKKKVDQTNNNSKDDDKCDLYEKISKVPKNEDPDVYIIEDKVDKIKKTKKRKADNDLDDFIEEDEPKKTKFSQTTESQKTIPRFIQAFMREPPKRLNERELPVGAKNCLQGLTFVLTGILEFFERDDITSLIQKYGGRVTTSISRKTTYLVVGREPGESKLQKAKDLKIQNLKEEELYSMISDTFVQSAQPVKKIKEKIILKDEPKKLKSKTKENDLWVDKYKPKCFDDIIGQHGPKSPANKLKRWLLDWDENRHTKQKNFFAGKENGSIYKAALLSGQPGVGKTTTAQIICRELGYDIVELNASDSRNKKLLENTLASSLNNTKINNIESGKSVLIMDEVDGMSGNEDRGGIQEIIALIKTTKTPIICICNDRNHQKIRSLTNHCFDLRFYKPRSEWIRTYISKIAKSENVDIEDQAIDQMILAYHNDIRSIINNLQMTSSTKNTFEYDDTKEDLLSASKDNKESIFEVARKIFTKSNPQKFTISQKLDLFFVDYSLIPLFVFENYLITSNAEHGFKKLMCIAKAADSISHGDLCDKIIRSTNSWSLLPTQGALSSVIPTDKTAGSICGNINFPQWLGKNSTTTKNKRLIQTLTHHSQLKCRMGKSDFILDYLPYFNGIFYNPILNEEPDGVDKVISMLIEYDFTKEDWDEMVDLYQWNNLKLPAIPTKLKSAFTRTYNKTSRLLPYSLISASITKSKSIDINFENDEETADEDNDNIEEKDPMLKTTETNVSKSKPKESKTPKRRKLKQ